jgi:hypothetical protein
LANITLNLFQNDFTKFSFITLDSIVLEQAAILLKKYGKFGLRTLDSIHFSTAFLLTNQVDLFLSSDKLLNSFFKNENLNIEF